MKFTIFICIFLLVSCQQASNVDRSSANLLGESQEMTVHGFKHVDPYYWLEAKNDHGEPAENVRNLINDENAKTERFFNKHDELLKTIYGEIKERHSGRSRTVLGYEDEDFIYSEETLKNAEYPIQYIENKTTGKRSILLDKDKRAEGAEYYKVMGLSVSPKHRYVAWVEDTVGNIRGNLFVRGLNNDKPIIHSIKDVSAFFVWGKDDSSIYYTKLDEDSRSFQIRHIDLVTKIDTEIFTETDEALLVYPERTLSEKGVIITSTNWSFSESQIIWFDEGFDKLHMVVPREYKVSISLQHLNEGFFAIHKIDGESYVLSTFNDIKAPRDKWTTIYQNRYGSIAEHEYLRNYIAIVDRANGADTLLKYHLQKGTIEEVYVNEEAYGVSIRSHSVNTLRIRYESYFTPRTVIDVDLSTDKSTVISKPDLPSFDRSKYMVERVEIPSHDGVLIPATIIKKKDLPKGPNPVYQYVYGSYGFGIPPEFPSFAFSMIDRGFIYVVSHVRGGDEKGDSWHDGGRLFNRKNTFYDFEAISNYLIENGITTKGEISVSGESGAGVVVGVVANNSPDTYRSFTVLVPAFDLMNKLLNPNLLITKTEWSEFGNPIESKEAFEYINSYAPMENFKRQEYPASYVTGAFDDPAVSYYEPLKWTVAKREHNTKEVTSLVHIRPGGHIDSKAGSVEMEFAKQMVFMLAMHDMTGSDDE